ncbi:MAG: hypothetical protein JWR19_2033 [Pedosphaera sp.]|nr:hypothetical protein [Pedosphaera sp.]
MLNLLSSSKSDIYEPQRQGNFAANIRQYTLLVCLTLLLCGCQTSRRVATSDRRPFDFQHDTFAYANELVWEYHYDEHGKWVSHARHPAPDYSHHCFVVARSARQFFEHARFEPTQPVADATTYQQLIHQVLALGANHELPDSRKVVIPGYADLHSFSQAWESLLKSECGGAWQSYLQRGHWRMIGWFSRQQQEKVARQLTAAIQDKRPPVVHLVRFPQLTINHAVVLFDAAETDQEINFTVYDPNNPVTPTHLIYDRVTRTFQFPANDYFPGGRVDVYEVYRGWFY